MHMNITNASNINNRFFIKLFKMTNMEIIHFYIQLYSPRMVENKMKKERKREENNMYRIEKKLDYDLTNIHSLANSVDL